jgi:hypothetical protein
MSMPRFYSVLPFPFEGHEYFNLVDTDLSLSLAAGQVVQASRAPLVLRRGAIGKPMDFSTTAFGVPVLSRRAADGLMPLISGDVQLLPAQVADGEAARFEMFVVNVSSRLDCLYDGTPSTAMEGDFGCIEVTTLRIDPSKVGSHNMFRLVGSEADLIVTHKVRAQIEVANLVGPAMLSLDDKHEQVMPGFK